MANDAVTSITPSGPRRPLLIVFFLVLPAIFWSAMAAGFLIKGPLIVMVHGFPDFWYTWRKQMDALSGQYQVAALDLRPREARLVEQHHRARLEADDRVGGERHARPRRVDQSTFWQPIPAA